MTSLGRWNAIVGRQLTPAAAREVRRRAAAAASQTRVGVRACGALRPPTTTPPPPSDGMYRVVVTDVFVDISDRVDITTGRR